MNKFSKSIFLSVSFFFGMGAASSIGVAADDRPLRVGISPTSPPIRFWDGNTISGLEADFAQKLGKELSRPVELVDMKFSNLIPTLLSGEIDIIMSGMSVTHIRNLQLAFSEPYMIVNQMALVRSEERNNYLSAMDIVMTDKTVGAKENTTAEFLIVQEFPKAKKRLYSTPDAGAKALIKKRIDLLIMDSPYVWWLAKENEGKLSPLPYALTQENLAWAVRKSDAELLNSVNALLAKWKETGEWSAIVKKWLPEFTQ